MLISLSVGIKTFLLQLLRWDPFCEKKDELTLRLDPFREKKNELTQDKNRRQYRNVNTKHSEEKQFIEVKVMTNHDQENYTRGQQFKFLLDKKGKCYLIFIIINHRKIESYNL